MTHRVALVAAALAAALLLTGCTEVKSIGEEAGIDLALTGLTTALDEQHGVTLNSATSMDADYRFAVTVMIDRAEVTADNRDAIIHAVEETLAGGAFGSATRWFSIGTDAEPYYSQNIFGLETLTTDLEYWHAVEDVVGDVSFSVSEPEGDGPFTRIRSIQKSSPMDYGALASVSLDSTALDSWGSPGVGAQGTLPSAEIAAALAAVTEIVPFYQYSDGAQPPAVDLMWSGLTNTSSWTLHSSGPADLATDPEASSDWPVAVEVISLLIAAGVADSHFSFFNDATAGGIVHLGECDAEISAGPPDTELFDSLRAAGVALPAGSAPGWCSAG